MTDDEARRADMALPFSWGLMWRHYLTAADGRTYAIGRAMAVPLFIVGLMAPVVLAIAILCTQRPLPSLPDWGEYLLKTGMFWTAWAAALAALIWGTNPTEPGLGASPFMPQPTPYAPPTAPPVGPPDPPLHVTE